MNLLLSEAHRVIIVQVAPRNTKGKVRMINMHTHTHTYASTHSLTHALTHPSTHSLSVVPDCSREFH